MVISERRISRAVTIRLSLILTHDHIKKLGLDIKDLGVGDVLHMHAHGRVTHVSSDQNHSKGPGEPKQRQRVELSLHKAAVHNPQTYARRV